VQLRSSGENEGEKKSANEPGGAKRMPGPHFPRDESRPHWARLCFLPTQGASPIWRYSCSRFAMRSDRACRQRRRPRAAATGQQRILLRHSCRTQIIFGVFLSYGIDAY
jgi:hypothetical protein